ncbi:JAB domain-containing protein [Parerythrobacter aurantius]|uniref:JAB domain-containing protein n=1 Tax=Parerythrobacter aurantius TaxID=3127706 RepID=UPI003250C541
MLSSQGGAIPPPLADPAFLGYLHAKFEGAAEERLHIVYCDAAQRYLHDETFVIGSSRHLVLKARPLVHRALSIGAGSLIMAHNHLSGRCRPSPQDIHATHRLQELGAALELTLIDHLIFTRERFFSMAAAGLLA